MTISKTDARHLARLALEMGARVLRGTLTADGSETRIDETKVLDWLAQLTNGELMLIAVPMAEITAEEVVKSCNTCGRDYKGNTCPYCAEARARLRG